MNLKAPFVLISALFLLLVCGGSSFSSMVIDANAGYKKKGYNAIINYEDGFIAVGSNGRIDRISKSGDIVKSERFPEVEFKSLLSHGQTIIAVGDEGSILISADKGVFKKIDGGTHKNINSLVPFNDYIIAGSDGGELLIGDETGTFEKIQLALEGNIVSLSAGVSRCYGVTDQGEIIHTEDGVSWKIFDFNNFYSGYYKPCRFTSVLVTENQIAVTGKNQDGLPVLIFSSQGNVWTERELNYTDEQGMTSYLKEVPNNIFYDFSREQFVLICDKGKMMTIPSCSHCNKLFELTIEEDLTGISSNENKLIIVGENYYIKVINFLLI